MLLGGEILAFGVLILGITYLVVRIHHLERSRDDADAPSCCRRCDAAFVDQWGLVQHHLAAHTEDGCDQTLGAWYSKVVKPLDSEKPEKNNLPDATCSDTRKEAQHGEDEGLS